MRDEVEWTVRLLSVPDGVTELRAIADNGTHSGYFSDPALIASASELLDLATVHGVYVTLNEVAPALLARRANRVKMRLGAKDATTSDSDILRRRWFPIDIDPVRPSGVSSTDEERECAFRKAEELAAWLTGHGFPEPLRGDSGNGAHLLYRIDLPNDEESKNLVQQCLSVLAFFFSDERCTVDTAVFNAGRIWKLYGTVSRKGDHTVDRPHRRSHILSVPDPIEIVSKGRLEDLAGLLSPDDIPANAGANPGNSSGIATTRPASTRSVQVLPSRTPVPGQNPMKVYQDGNAPLNLPNWLREHGLAIRNEKPWQGGRLFVLDECPFSTAHRDGAFVIQFPNGAIYAGCKHASCGGGKQRWQELRRMHDREYAERELQQDQEGLATGASGTEPRTLPGQANQAKTGVNGTTRETQAGQAKAGEYGTARGTRTGSEEVETRGKEDPRKGTEGPSPPKKTGTADPNDNAARTRAREILQSGDPRSFILNTFAKCHVGDGIVAACYLVSILSTTVANSRGLHVCPTGDSGKGKSDSANAFIRLLPEDAKMQGSITSKALFYHGIKPGSAIIFDDFSMSEDLREVLKNATSSFQHELEHYTLNANRQPVVLSLPERCVWWILSVDNPGDDQVLNRMMNPWIDDSEQQDRRVRDHIFALARRFGGASREDRDIAVCRELFSLVREHLYTVRIPFAHRIQMDSIRNRRNPIMLLDIIRSFAALRFMQREQRTLSDGLMEIDAAEEDFHDAARLFSALDSTDGGQTSKLLKNEKLLIDSIIAMKAEEFTVKDLQAWMGLSYVIIRRILHGRPDRIGEPGGLLSKCPAFGVVEMTTSEGTIAAVIRTRENHYFFDYERYKAWSRGNGVWLSSEDTDRGDDGNDPDDQAWVKIGSTNWSTSNSLENSSNENQGDIVQDNNNNSTILSQNSESAILPSAVTNSRDPPDTSSVCHCDPGHSDHENENISYSGKNDNQTPEQENNIDPGLDQIGKTSGSLDHIREQDYIALPNDSTEPCHVCGDIPTTSVRKRRIDEPPDSPDKYLCYSCLKQAQVREREEKRLHIERIVKTAKSGAIPIPGLLVPTDFIRVKFSQGKCDICGGNEAVYKSNSKNTNCCEKCYGRLVREGNRVEGVG
ncbi:hypothetical protein [Methanolinea mesophila]|nr:hypothetical protein [Methanolinea mesophila]